MKSKFKLLSKAARAAWKNFLKGLEVTRALGLIFVFYGGAFMERGDTYLGLCLWIFGVWIIGVMSRLRTYSSLW